MLTGKLQVHLAEDCEENCTFVYRLGTFQLKIMTLGFIKAPSSFHRMMDIILHELPFVRVYLKDDKVVQTPMDEHIAHIMILFERTQAPPLKQNI